MDTEGGAEEGHAPEEGQDPRFRTGLAWLSLEADQADPPAALATAAGLPLLDVRPSALINGVVDGHDDAHIRRLGVVVFAGHRRVELRLGRVHPIFLIIARNGGDLSGGGEESWSWSGRGSS